MVAGHFHQNLSKVLANPLIRSLDLLIRHSIEQSLIFLSQNVTWRMIFGAISLAASWVIRRVHRHTHSLSLFIAFTLYLRSTHSTKDTALHS